MSLIDKQKLEKLLIVVSVFIASLVSIETVSAANPTYSPYPIIFVHGVDSNEAKTWKDTKSNLEIYFKDQNSYKYFHDSRNDYFPYCDYGWQNNGSIPNIAMSSLMGSIEAALKSFSSEVPESERKVVIVAHSMGGLVVRSLLKQKPEYQNKIDKVIFIGSPHLGAPAASALWILKELNKDNSIVTKYSKFYSASAFSGFKFKPIAYSPYVFSRVASKLAALKTNIVLLIKTAKTFGPDPDGIALEELRLAGDVNYHTSITDFFLFQFIREDISLGHSGTETFLGQNNLNTPSNYKTIRGVNNYGGKVLAWSISQLIDNFGNNFTFPVLNGELQSLENAKNIGDGIVSQLSQEGLGSADYTVNAFHTEEPKQYQPILQAIDDKPLLDLSVIPGDGGSYLTPPIPPTFYYIKVKVKDYLLADIEIADMIVNGTKLDLTGFLDPQTNTYRPYFKYGKDFLKERPDADAPLFDAFGKRISDLTLKPGEFWVRINSPRIYDLFVKVRNPAQKETFKEIVLPRYMNTFRPANAQGSTQNGLSFSDISQAAYASLLSGKKRVLDEGVDWHYTLFLYRIGMEAHSTDSPYQGTGPDGIIRTEHNYTANIFSFYGSWVGLRFNSPPDLIKPFKLSFPTSFVGQFADSNQDINIRVYHDSSNAWPPAPDSSADTLLSTFNITPFMSQYIEVDIDPQRDIGPGGWYVLQFRPDFEEYNCIPDPAVGNFYRMAEVYPPGYSTPYPYVTVEEKEEFPSP